MAWLFKQAASEKWWVGFRENGKQFRRSTGTADKAEAEKQLEKLNAIASAKKSGRLTSEFIKHLTGKEQSNLSLVAALKGWTDESEGSTAPGTIARYKTIAREFGECLNATEAGPLLRDITPEHVRAYLTQKRAKTSASNANLIKKILSSFFKREIVNESISSNPVLPVKRFKVGNDNKFTREAYTLAELQLIYAKAPNDFWRYMILGEFYTGLRMGDLICMQYGFIDPTAKRIRLTDAKTGKQMIIPLFPRFLSLLNELHAKAGKVKASDYLWPDAAKRYQSSGPGMFSNEFYSEILTPCGLVPVRKNKKASGRGRAVKRTLNRVSFHSLRHSFVSFLKLTGSNQAIAMELAGHNSEAISNLYTHNPEEALVSAINQLPEFVK